MINVAYHFHRRNNFDNEVDYFVHEHRYLRTSTKEEYYKRNNENIRYDNIIQEIQSPWLNHVLEEEERRFAREKISRLLLPNSSLHLEQRNLPLTDRTRSL